MLKRAKDYYKNNEEVLKESANINIDITWRR